VWAAVATVVAKGWALSGGARSCVQRGRWRQRCRRSRRNQASSPHGGRSEVGPCSGRWAGGLRAWAMSTPPSSRPSTPYPTSASPILVSVPRRSRWRFNWMKHAVRQGRSWRAWSSEGRIRPDDRARKSAEGKRSCDLLQAIDRMRRQPGRGRPGEPPGGVHRGPPGLTVVVPGACPRCAQPGAALAGLAHRGVEGKAGSPVAVALPARGRPPQAAARRPALRV
jgi:hypothetical protein